MWDERIFNPNLVPHCLFCTRRLGYDFEVCDINCGSQFAGLIPVSKFKLHIAHYPAKADIWFQYDPPVLIVGATLHEEEDTFCHLLRQHIALCYRKNVDSVCAPTDPLLSFS